MKLLIGNKNYSSWSLRGWLACKQSRLAFTEEVVSLYDAEWAQRRQEARFAPSAGKVPILWDGDSAIWDSLAIIEYLNEKSGNRYFWPEDPAARALARSMAAEMHAGFPALRSNYTMNIRLHHPSGEPGAEAMQEIRRITHLWTQARARHGGGGDFLFGDFGAADIMFAPVATRFVSHALPVSPLATRYIEAVLGHPFLQDWIAAAQEESWVIDKFEPPVGD